MLYRVSVSIDVESDSPKAAAEKAAAHLRKTETIQTYVTAPRMLTVFVYVDKHGKGRQEA